MTRLFRCFVLCGAVSLTLGATRATAAQENPAAEASRRLQLRSEQLAALYFEAASIHNGFVHTIDVARFGDCSQAQKVASDLDAPPNRLKALRQVTKTSRYTNRFLFAMEPELREQVRSMNEKDRTGVIKLASGECLLSEVVEYQQRPIPEPKELGPTLALMVDRGWLPHPDLLEQDPKLGSRTVVNRVRSVADVEALPAGFDINTRRSDGYTVLTSTNASCGSNRTAAGFRRRAANIA